jgi:hypothetical protein
VPLHAAWARPHLDMLFRSPSGGPHYNWVVSNKRGTWNWQTAVSTWSTPATTSPINCGTSVLS